MRKMSRNAAMIGVVGMLVSGGLAVESAAAAPPGYWTGCVDLDPAKGAYAFKHHNASCATARRLARTFSTENSRPEGWDCDYSIRRAHNLYKCTKVPGSVPWAVSWRKVRLVH